jgi:hypothetical protein
VFNDYPLPHRLKIPPATNSEQCKKHTFKTLYPVAASAATKLNTLEKETHKYVNL